jgi:uncharacterized membrane protein YbjE (DUF340 family)
LVVLGNFVQKKAKMKNSLYILIAFVLGLMLGKLFGEFSFITYSKLTEYILMLLLFLVGADLGSDKSLLTKLRSTAWQSAVFPFVPLLGTYLGCAIYLIIFPKQPTREVLAIGSGLGFYSLTGAMVTSQSGVIFGTLAVLVNLIREIATLTLAPIMVRFFGPWAPIATGGATSMDTTLPIIAKFSGEEYALPAVYSGVILSLAVPLLLSLIYLVF